MYIFVYALAEITPLKIEDCRIAKAGKSKRILI